MTISGQTSRRAVLAGVATALAAGTAANVAVLVQAKATHASGFDPIHAAIEHHRTRHAHLQQSMSANEEAQQILRKLSPARCAGWNLRIELEDDAVLFCDCKQIAELQSTGMITLQRARELRRMLKKQRALWTQHVAPADRQEKKAWDEFNRAEREMVKTVPTTASGIAALLAYVREVEEAGWSIIECPGLIDRLLMTLEAAARRLAAEVGHV